MPLLNRLDRLNRLAPAVVLLSVACNDVEVPEGCHTHGDEIHCDEHGVASRLILNLTPSGGGETQSFVWSDPEADGNPEVDDIVLQDGSDNDTHVSETYDLTIEVWNDLENPPEDLKSDILEQDDQHQFFFTGSAVDSPATSGNTNAVIQQTYADADENGLPVGLENTFTTTALGSGELTVTLRHMPPEDGQPVKVEGLAETVASEGMSAIGGGNDIQVTFNIEVE